MKKKRIKALELNKTVVSKLSLNHLQGGFKLTDPKDSNYVTCPKKSENCEKRDEVVDTLR